MNNTQLKKAKLFNVTALTKHLHKVNYYLALNRKPSINFCGGSPALFTLYYGDNIIELPNHSSSVPLNEILSLASISDIMDYLIENNIIQDEEILRSWKEHIEWYTILEEELYSASNIAFPYPEFYSNNPYEYSDIFIIQRFADLLPNITEVSLHSASMNSQYKIINEILPFVVDELLPLMNCCMEELSVEQITDLVQKISIYLTKLFWIYTL